jgi:succinate dehydrogenase flavin-adding protein (antitoxin of CptAB toxin-antitoxin module)
MKTTKLNMLIKEYRSFVQSNEDKFGVEALNEFEKIIEMEDPRDELTNFFDKHSEKYGNDEQIILNDINKRCSLMSKGTNIQLHGICLDVVSGKPFEFTGEIAVVYDERIWDSVYFTYNNSIWFAPLSHVTKIN